MKKLSLLAVALLSTSALASETTPPAASVWLNAQPVLQLKVKPAAPGTYSVNAVISDKATGKVLERPSLVIKAGTWGRAEVGAKGAPGLVLVSLSVSVEPSGRAAAYFAEFHREGGHTDMQSGTLLVSK